MDRRNGDNSRAHTSLGIERMQPAPSSVHPAMIGLIGPS
jgi:hypothetical protein